MINLSETYTYEGHENWSTGKRVTAQRKIKTGDTVTITFLGASEEHIKVNTFNGSWDVYDDVPAIGENYYFEVVVNGTRTYYGKYAEERYTDASVGTGGVVYGSNHDCIDENQVRKAFNSFKEWLTNGAKDNNYWHGLYVKKDFPETISYGMPGEVIEPEADKAIVSPPGVVVEEGDGVFSVDGIRYEIFDARSYSGGKTEYIKAARVLHSAYEGKVEIPAKVMYHRRWRLVTQIDEGALSNCPDLVEVSIPATVNWIRGNVSGCPALTAIHVDAANERYASIDGVVYNKERTEIICYPEGHGESFEIPDTVKSIGKEFNGCTALRYIVIPQSVTKIGRESFLGCTGLLEINIPGGDSIIIDSFNDCTSLQSITLGEGIQSIVGSFCNCTSLKKLILPDSLESVSSSSFCNCGIVEDVRFPKGRLISIKAVSDKYYPWRQDPFFIDGVYYVPYFDREGKIACVRVADVPKDQLAQLSFPGVETLTIPSTVEQYGFSYRVAQFWCYCEQFPNLHRLELPETVLDYRGTIPGLKEYVVSPDNPEYASIDGILYSKDKRRLLAVPSGLSLSKLIVLEGVELISERAFMNHTELQEVVLSDSVREIGCQAFENCTSLCKVHFNKGLEKIGSAAFAKTALTSIVLPASVKDVCQKPFSGRLPFFGCRELKEFVMDEESGPFTVIDGLLYEKSKWGLTLVCCPPGYAGNLTLPDDVTKIGQHAMWGIEKLEAVIMPDTVERIESWAMAECKSLKEVVLSRKLRFVDSCAFRECPSLEELDFTLCRDCYGYDAIDTSAFMKNPQLKLILPSNLESQRQYFERKMKDQ